MYSKGNKRTQDVYYDNDKTVLPFKHGHGLTSCLQREYQVIITPFMHIIQLYELQYYFSANAPAKTPLKSAI